MENTKDRIILSMDISTTTIGISIFKVKPNNTDGEILVLTHVTPKISKNIKGIETLFVKKQIFEEEFLKKYANFGITDVIVEEPLLRSNNVNTISTLLRFNGIITDSVYNTLGLVTNFISSYDARKYAFPELLAIRKFDKKGGFYPYKKYIKTIEDSIKGKGGLTLFSEYLFDVDKKRILWDKINEKYPSINWLYNKKGVLCKENFDMSDSLICVLGFLNKERYGDYSPSILSYNVENEGSKPIISYEFEHINKKDVIKHKINIT